MTLNGAKLCYSLLRTYGNSRRVAIFRVVAAYVLGTGMYLMPSQGYKIVKKARAGE